MTDMPEDKPAGEIYTTTIHGSVDSSQIAIGKEITQTMTIIPSEVIGENGLAQLNAAIATLRDHVAADTPQEKQSEASELVDELEQAITAGTPDLSTMEYVRNWFARNVPKLAGAVTAIIIHPLVGRLVEAAGDALVSEFQQRFGGTDAS